MIRKFDETDAADAAGVAARRRETISGTSGDDRLTGTAGRDTFLLYDGGSDHARGFEGKDHFIFESALDRSDRIDGGEDDDDVRLAGQPREVLDQLITSAMFTSIEKLILDGSSGFDIRITDGLDDLKVRSGKRGTSVDFDGSALTTGSLDIRGGNGGNDLIGGHGDDRFVDGAAVDTMTGGEGLDRFVIISPFASRPGAPDTITDFEAGDAIRLPVLSGAYGYHIGSTPGHVGDVLVSYDEDHHRTSLSIFTNDDSQPDILVYLSGDLDVAIAHDHRVILA